MFLYGGNGETDGPAPIGNKEFFKKLANRCIELLSTYTAEGRCYRVDLRLRPDGRLGEIVPLARRRAQLLPERARDWELQMLIKARVSAGDRRLGRSLLEFAGAADLLDARSISRAVESMSATRERISEKLAARKGWQAGFDIKLARGGIRDIEFLVQCLQRLHGGREPWVRHGGTLLALFRLRDKDLLSDAEYSRLASAYQFLRNLEHRLQFADDRQTHTLPADPEELERAGAQDAGGRASAGLASADTLLRASRTGTWRRCRRSTSASSTPSSRCTTAMLPPATPGSTLPEEEPVYPAEGSASNLIRFLDQRAPQLAESLSRSGPAPGARSASSTSWS